MSTQRYISTSFYDDRWIQSLDPTEKFIYLYLLTNPLTNIAGVYKIEDRRISFDTGFTKEVVSFVLEKFEKAGKVYRMNEYIVIPSWPKHQKWEKAQKIKEGIILCLMKIGEEYLKKLSEMNYKFDLKIVYDRLSIPYIYPSNYSDSDSDINISGSNEPPKDLAVSRKKSLALTEEQKTLFHAAKACFESSARAKAIMYQDRGSAQMHTENLKLFVRRCTNMAPGITADFMRTVLEHFKVLVNGKLKNKAEFTPRALITPWIWEMVIGSLPENNITEEIRESIRRMFK